MTEKSEEVFGVDQEGGATPLINDKHHGPASNPLPRRCMELDVGYMGKRCTAPACDGRPYCRRHAKRHPA